MAQEPSSGSLMDIAFPRREGESMMDLFEEAKPATVGQRLKTAAHYALSGAAEIPLSLAEQEPIFARALGMEQKAQDIEGAVGAMRGAVGGLVEPVPESESFLTKAVPSALGSGLGFLAGGGLLGKALPKVSALARIAGLGAAVESSGLYYEAKAHGASEGEAWIAWLAGLGLGGTEALPLARILGRLEKKGVDVEGILVRSLWEGTEEAAQESLQTLGENVVAKNLYDEDRKFLENLNPNTPAGFIAGFLLSGGSGVIQRARQAEPGGEEATLERAGPLSPEAPVGEGQAPKAEQAPQAAPEAAPAPVTGEEAPGSPEPQVPVEAPTEAPEGRAAPRSTDVGIDVGTEEVAAATPETAQEAPQPTSARELGKLLLQANKRPGRVVEPPTGSQAERVAQRLRARGVEPVFVDAGKPLARPGVYLSGAAALDIRQPEMALKRVGWHELAHHLRAASGQEWKALYERIKATDREGLVAALKEYRARAKKAGVSLSAEALQEETVSQYAENLGAWLEHLADNPAEMVRIARGAEGRSLLTKVLDAIKRMLQKAGVRARTSLQKVEDLRREIAETALEKELDPQTAARLALVINEALDVKGGAAEGDVKFAVAPPTDSSEFRRWFGTSKVVAKDGKPLIVYHGTWRPEQRTIFPKGSYFTSSPALAGSYTQLRAGQETTLGTQAKTPRGLHERFLTIGRPRIEPVYLAIQHPWNLVYAKGSNPFSVDPKEREAATAGDRLAASLGATHEQILVAMRTALPKWQIPRKGEKAGDALLRSMGWFDLGRKDVTRLLTGRSGESFDPQLLAILEQLGFDGVMFSDYAVGGQLEERRYANSYVVFHPEQAKSAVGNIGAYDPINPDIRFALAPPFYSRLEEVVEGLNQKRFSAGQLDALVRKAPGVTKEELAWVGWEEMLAGRKSVTKEEALEWLRAHRIEVRENVLGGPSEEEIAQQARSRLEGLTDEELAREIVRTANADIEHAREIVADDRGRVIDRYVWAERDESEAPRHGEYQLPGGENYRELLLTLGSQEETERERMLERMRALNTRMWEYHDDPSQPLLSEHPPELVREYNELRERLANFNQPYTGGHFDEPNVLAHVRFNERTDVDGKRVLFIEEVQSDWHQEGRRRGYSVRRPRQVETGRWEVHQFNPDGTVTNYGFDTREEADVWAERVRMVPREALVQPEVVDMWEDLGAVPDAPFKTSWPSLSLKRVIKWAADNGFDSVAWTTGAQQVERYETALRQNVDQIRWSPRRDPADGTTQLWASSGGEDVIGFAFDERGVIQDAAHQELQGKTLEDVLGKEIAKRILSEESGSVSEEGLTIGGKGMQDFYDKILVNAANKLGKRFGVKAKTLEVQLHDVPKEDRYHIVAPSGQVVDRAQTRLIANNVARQRGEGFLVLDTGAESFSAPVHALPITDDMRATVGERGFSTFAPKFAQAREEQAVPASAEEIEGEEDVEGTTAVQVGATRPRKRGKTVGAFLQKYLTSRGNLPSDAFAANIAREGWMNMHEQRTRFLIRDLARAIKKEIGKLTPEQQERVNRALAGSLTEDLLPETYSAVKAMREHINFLSRQMIDAGVVEGDLAAHIARDLDKAGGTYLTRSYQVFDDPRWAEKVPVGVRNKAKALLRKEHQAARRKARQRLEKSQPDLSMEEIEAQLPPAMTEEELEGRIQNLLYEGKAAQSPVALLAKAKLGSKDLSILQRRKDISPEIRALYGEYKDPIVNYARSVSKMARLIANHEFLTEIRRAGLGQFFHEKPLVRGDEEFKVRIAADSSKVMFPLNGLYTTPEILEAFEEALEIQRDASPWLRAYMRINGTTKLSKTVLSAMTAIRNVTGNAGFATANGHWRVMSSATALKSIAAKWGLNNEQKWRSYYERALELGVIHESARAGELRDIIRDMSRHGASKWMESRAVKAAKLPVRAAIEFYRVGDDVWKLYAWENEKARYRRAYPEWSQEELEKQTAEIVRNTYPTYSLVPRMIKGVRMFPVVGTFVSFPAEVFRTAGYTVSLTAKELANPRTRSIGAERAAGTLLAATATAAGAALVRFLVGVNADDDEDARWFVPPWSKFSDLFWLSRNEKGNWLYVDASYTDPYNYLKEPIMALLRGDDWQEKVAESFKAAAAPFLSEEILFSAITDVLRNRTQTGRTIYNESASYTDKAQAMAGHLYKALEPGTVTSLQRIHKGLRGHVEAYGRSYDPKVETLAAFSGVRIMELDVHQSLMFRAKEYGRAKSDAGRMLRSVLSRRGTVTDEEILDARASSEQTRQTHFERMRKITSAAQGLGLTWDDVEQALSSGGVSKDDIRALRKNGYKPYKPGRSWMASLRKSLGSTEYKRRTELLEAATVDRSRTGRR